MPNRVLYLDPFSGIAGDMLVGALLDLGLNLEDLKQELSKLDLSGYELRVTKVLRCGIVGSKFDVLLNSTTEDAHRRAHALGLPHDHARPSHTHTTYADIKARIERSGLSARVKQQSIRAFQVLAEAEGRMHNQSAEKVHFHEVGAVDSIVDFVSACAGLDLLGIDELRCGPVALGGEGGGYVECAHGTLPVPAFATLDLMKGLPIRSCPVKEELTTPTGAALLKALVAPEYFGPLPMLNIEKVGYGAGSRNDPHIRIPNLLRAVLGTTRLEAKPSAESRTAQVVSEWPSAATTDESDTVVEISANLDDAEPEVLGYAMEKLLAQGALDVFFTPVQMKKSRPGTLLTVIALPEKRDELMRQIFRETTTFGVRYVVKQRAKLKRATEHLKTPWGSVRVKVGTWKGERVSLHPEYEDCKAIAEHKNIPLRMVLDFVRAQFVLVEKSK